MGIRGSGIGSLKEFNIDYNAVLLNSEERWILLQFKNAIKPNTKMIGIQRSKGYANRPFPLQ